MPSFAVAFVTKPKPPAPRQHGETARVLRQLAAFAACLCKSIKLQDAAGISKVHLWLGANRVANFDALSCVDIPNTSFRLSRRPSESGHCLKVLPRSRKRGSQRMDKKHRISHDSCRIVRSTRRCLKQMQQGQIDYVSKCINIVCT